MDVHRLPEDVEDNAQNVEVNAQNEEDNAQNGQAHTHIERGEEDDQKPLDHNLTDITTLVSGFTDICQ